MPSHADKSYPRHFFSAPPRVSVRVAAGFRDAAGNADNGFHGADSDVATCRNLNRGYLEIVIEHPNEKDAEMLLRLLHDDPSAVKLRCSLVNSDNGNVVRLLGASSCGGRKRQPETLSGHTHEGPRGTIVALDCPAEIDVTRAMLHLARCESDAKHCDSKTMKADGVKMCGCAHATDKNKVVFMVRVTAKVLSSRHDNSALRLRISFELPKAEDPMEQRRDPMGMMDVESLCAQPECWSCAAEGPPTIFDAVPARKAGGQNRSAKRKRSEAEAEAEAEALPLPLASVAADADADVEVGADPSALFALAAMALELA
jgi:hypothetical protein